MYPYYTHTQVIGITTGICVGSWILCFAAFDWAVPAFGILGQVDTAHALAFATLGATLMMTRSPASAVSTRLMCVCARALETHGK